MFFVDLTAGFRGLRGCLVCLSDCVWFGLNGCCGFLLVALRCFLIALGLFVAFGF